MVHNPLGSFICLKEVHPEKTSVPSVSNPEGNETESRAVQPENMSLLNRVMPSFILTSLNLEQSEKA